MWQRNRIVSCTYGFFSLGGRLFSGLPTKSINVKPRRDIPGSSMLRNMIKYSGRQSLDKFQEDIQQLFDKYGPIFQFNMPGLKMVFVSHPEDIEHVFRNEDEFPLRGVHSSFATYFKSKGLKEGISGDDDSWKHHRSCTAPNMMLPRQNQGYMSGLNEIAVDSVSILNEGRNTNLLPLLQLWAAESVLYVMFGHRTYINLENCDEDALALSKAAFNAFESESKLIFSFPWYKYFKTPELQRFFKACDTLSIFTRNFMTKIRNKPTALPDGFESVFQKICKEKKLSDEEIIQVTATLLTGGVDTTSTMLLSTLHMLSKHQNCQEKLYAEIRNSLHNDEVPTYEHLTKMPYLKATIHEVFRTNLLVLGTSRKLSKSIVLSGYEVPPGTIITLSSTKPKQLQQKLYSDDEKFKPERWLRENKDFHPFSLLPFGFGRRMCVGRRIAIMEISLFLICFLQKYKIEENLRPSDQLDWNYGIVLRPDRPFNVYLTKRCQ